MTDRISPILVHDTVLNVAHPAWASITVDGHTFEASEPDDWRQALAIAAVTSGIIAIPPGSAPGPAWTAAARRFATIVFCSCGEHPLDPDHTDAFALHLCQGCYDLAGWENTHSDYDHDSYPDPDCPLCRPATGQEG